MAIFDITVMVIVIIFVYQACRCVPGFLIAFVHEVGVCVCVCAHARMRVCSRHKAINN